MSRLFVYTAIVLLGSISLTITQGVTAQPIHIKGSVMNAETFEFLHGVHVYSKVKKGVSSDIDGNFTITLDYNDTLLFSMQGFRTLTFLMEDTTLHQSMLVKLTPSTIMLDEVSVNDNFQAESVVIAPEKNVHRVTGVRYPENPKGENYRLGVGGAIFSPATAVYRLLSSSYKEEKRARREKAMSKKDAVLEERVKKKMRETLALHGEKIDDYYLLDFIFFLGLSLKEVDHMYVYDLTQKSKGQLELYFDALEANQE